jgi:hypothetical protein
MCSTTIDAGSGIAALVEQLCGCTVYGLASIRGGRNSRVMRAETNRGAFAVKHYPQDGRDRLAVEYEALSFLTGCGLAMMPRPLACDRTASVAVYEWIEGVPIGTADVAAIDAALAALADIHALAGRARAGDWSHPASASIFAPAEAIAQLRARRARFDTVAPHDPRLAAFLARFDERCEQVLALTRCLAKTAGIAWATPLAIAYQTLSPSDFGFHNALRRPDGSVVFLDFEYFGWDDPAKLCSDFCLHPGMGLDENLEARFLRGARAIYGGADAQFAFRLAVMRPLCGLCWCMIVLNTFLLPHRSDTAPPASEHDAQLAKAYALLENIGRVDPSSLDVEQ